MPHGDAHGGAGASDSRGERFDQERKILRSVVDHMPDALVVADEAGKFLYFNRSAERILGIGALDITPERWSAEYGLFALDGTRLLPEQLPLHRALNGEPVTGEELLVRNPERKRGVIIQVNCAPLLDDEAGITGAVATFRDVTRSREAAARVAQFSTAIDRTADAVLIADRDGKIRYVNRAFELQTGYSRREVVGRKPSILKSGEHDAAFYRNLWETILAGREFQATILNRKKSGDPYWAAMTITPIPGEGGRPVRFVSLLKDVTEREAQLRHERDFNAAILSTAATPVLVVDPTGAVIRFNQACEAASGMRADQVIGRSLMETALVEADPDRWSAILDQPGCGERVREAQLPWKTAEGETRRIQWSFTALRDASGELSHLVASGVDVTQRLLALERLEESERRYRLLVENLHEGLWLIDEDGVTTFVNQRMSEMLGYAVDEMMGRVLFDFMDERGVEICKQNIERRKQGITEDHEFELMARDGTRIDTIMQASPITDREGRYRGSLAGVLDITLRKRNEQELRETRDQLEKKVDERTVELRAALGEVERLKDRLEAENVLLREEVRRVRGPEQIVGSSRAIRSALEQGRQVAPTHSTVLLLGETGVGKGLFARVIHELSALAEQPLVTVDCSALPATLIESELFGHEKGAFTGATRDRPGRFEMADGGTLFLDEIGELPKDLQPKMLRVLQSGRFERVGSSKTRRVRVRVIAATNRDLHAMVADGSFRADLFFRISVFPIRIPSLRERLEDIPDLVRLFVETQGHVATDGEVEIDPAVIELLMQQDWPGNVRELANTIERALILARDSRIRVGDIQTSLGSTLRGAAGSPGKIDPTQSGTFFEREREILLETLEACRWRIKGEGNAADRLGLPPSTLRGRMKRLGLQRPR